MGFFNSLSIRIPLALGGGILYALLTYAIVSLLNLPKPFALFFAVIVFLFYLGSRFLLLSSGIDTPYYTRGKEGSLFKNTTFYQRARWVGRFYHYHDIVLFAFLIMMAVFFLISLLIDWSGNKPFGDTFQNLWHAFFPMA